MFLYESTRPSLDIWYVVSPCGPLSNLLKIYSWDKNGSCQGSHRLILNHFFSEYGNLAYQVKGNEANILANMLVNRLLLHLTPWVESAYQCMQNAFPFYTPLPPVWGKR